MGRICLMSLLGPDLVGVTGGALPNLHDVAVVE